jgi:hypothetical protein
MTRDKKTNRSKIIMYPFFGQRCTNRAVIWCGYERKESNASVITISSFAIIFNTKVLHVPCSLFRWEQVQLLALAAGCKEWLSSRTSFLYRFL